RVDRGVSTIFAQRPIKLRRMIRRGIAEETRRVELDSGVPAAEDSGPSRPLLLLVLLAWIAYEVWTAVRFATVPPHQRPQDFIGTWIVVSAGFVALLALALRVRVPGPRRGDGPSDQKHGTGPG